ncbi:hypothetical protein [Streptomyces sp. NPDC003015]
MAGPADARHDLVRQVLAPLGPMRAAIGVGLLFGTGLTAAEDAGRMHNRVMA